MFSRIREFFTRHKRKFVITGVVIGGAWALSRIVQIALREFQERQAKAFLERTKKEQHFNSIDHNCNQTAVSLVPAVRESICKLVDTSTLVAELQQGTCDKLSTWEKLKILSFEKIIFLVYVTSILNVTLRVQLSILGGYVYRELFDNSDEQFPHELQKKYMATIENVLATKAGSRIAQVIDEKVRQLLAGKSLKEKMTLTDIEQLLWSVFMAIDADARNPIKLLPTYIATDSNDDEEIYRKIMLETQELLESAEIQSLVRCCISRGLSFVMDRLSHVFVSAESAQQNGSVAGSDEFFAANIEASQLPDLTNKSIPLAKIIPILNSFIATSNCGTDLLCAWSQQLFMMDNLRVMSANVYETFSSK